RAYRRQLRVPGSPPYRVRIRTTSDDLVPSMELTHQNPETHGLESFAWCRPRDFRRLPPTVGADRAPSGGRDRARGGRSDFRRVTVRPSQTAVSTRAMTVVSS